MALSFDKYEGLGNDFVIVDGVELDPAEVARICDRHRGVGADGVLHTGVRDGRPFMRVTNADGSVPEMCGNGLRCVALHLARRGALDGALEVELDTDAGPHRVTVESLEGATGRVRVGMRPARLDPASIPLASDAPWIDRSIEIDGHSLRVTAVSMGNPHAVTFDDVGAIRRTLGPALERDPRFPEGANVGFASLRSDALELHVWERGVGWTQACGTGACAAAVAAVETERAPRGADIRVVLPGGALTIRVDGRADPVWMTGPARHVFSGVLDR